MSNLTNAIAITSHMKLNFVMFFQKLVDVINFILKFLLKTTAAESSWKEVFFLAPAPVFSPTIYLPIYLSI